MCRPESHLSCGPFLLHRFLSLSHIQIFFPRSIENEIVARDAGIRSRGFFQSFRSRNHLTFVSQEQELYGTYDPEDTPVDVDKQSVSNFSPDQKPALLPPSAPLLRELPRPPLSHTPPLTPTEPIRLSPNRRQPSFDHHSLPTVRLSSVNKGNRYSNPATKVSWLRQSFRSPIGACPPPPPHARSARRRNLRVLTTTTTVGPIKISAGGRDGSNSHGNKRKHEDDPPFVRLPLLLRVS